MPILILLFRFDNVLASLTQNTAHYFAAATTDLHCYGRVLQSSRSNNAQSDLFWRSDDSAHKSQVLRVGVVFYDKDCNMISIQIPWIPFSNIDKR